MMLPRLQQPIALACLIAVALPGALGHQLHGLVGHKHCGHTHAAAPKTPCCDHLHHPSFEDTASVHASPDTCSVCRLLAHFGEAAPTPYVAAGQVVAFRDVPLDASQLPAAVPTSFFARGPPVRG